MRTCPGANGADSPLTLGSARPNIGFNLTTSNPEDMSITAISGITAGEILAGDAFTIGNVEAVHHITKQSTGQLKTFRVVAVPSGTTLVITPAIVSNQGGSDAEAQYQNCVVTAQSGTASITWLNNIKITS